MSTAVIVKIRTALRKILIPAGCYKLNLNNYAVEIQ